MTAAMIQPNATYKPRNEWADSLKGIIIAFAFALVFRAFVIEGFEIPTGSMAPTLMGQHSLVTSPASGKIWPVGPSPDSYVGPQRIPNRNQNYRTIDPMTGAEIVARDARLRAGDMVFILKYLFPFYTPKRYDVVVFKNPRDPAMNYIKRLIGLGPEELAIVDGDVFVRPLTSAAEPTAGHNTWALPNWTITRKPLDAQRIMWQPVFDTQFTPLSNSKDGRTWFRSPWKPDAPKAWSIENTPRYTYAGQGPSTLVWDTATRGINDYYPYNLEYPEEIRHSIPLPNGAYPVSDIRVAVSYIPSQVNQPLTLTLAARAHEFRWTIGDTTSRIEMRPAVADAPWASLATMQGSFTLPPNVASSIEFWHNDQSLSLFLNGKQLLSAVYDWSPDQRLRNTLGLSSDDVYNAPPNVLMEYARYVPPKISLSVPGPCTLTRIALDRDIHYQANNYAPKNDPTPSRASGTHSRAGQPAAATHPRQPVFLAEGEYFMCGDNSPQSLDARLWEEPYGWVAQNDPKTGVVGRDALIGHAFVVYFPGAYWMGGRLPVPDAGRVRLIR